MMPNVINRFAAFLLCILLSALGVSMAPTGFWWRALMLVPIVLVVIGIWDLIQRQHSILRTTRSLAMCAGWSS